MNRMKMNLRVKQHRYTMTRYKIIRGVLTKTNQSYSSEKEEIYFDYRDISFDDFRFMILDPLQKLDIEESIIISSNFGISRGYQSNEVISKMASTHILKSWE